MPYTYGYFNGTIGKDGDPIDAYLGPLIDQDFDVYVIDQVDEDTRAFDEHKVMFGFESKEAAHIAYLSCFNKGWEGFNNITTMSIEKFRAWLKNEDMLKYPASKLNMSAKIDFKNIATEERSKIIRMQGEVEEDKTLANLMKQAGDESLFDTLVLEIASPGGSVSEGLMIMVWLDQLSAAGKDIVTVVTANAYSIASLIMLAANYRVISKHGRVMVHNPMVPTLEYVNASELEKYAVQLRELESVMYELYQLFTGLSEERIKELMDNETYLSPHEAVANGFADVVADIKPKSYQMTTNTNKKINMSKTLNILNRVIAKVSGADFINQLYYDNTGAEIEIFQKDPATYSVGDRTNVENGEVKLSDGATLKIKDFVIDEIDREIEAAAEPAVAPIVAPEPAVAPIVAPEPAVADPVAKPVVETKSKDEMPSSVIEKVESTVTTKEVVAAEISEISKWEVDVVNDTFDIGDKVEYKQTEEEDSPKSVHAGEYELEDGRKILVDGDAIIQFIKPATSVAPEAKLDEDGKPIVAAFNEGPAPKKVLTPEAVEKEDKMLGVLNQLHGAVTSLEKKVTALTGQGADAKAEIAKLQEFENLAAEAIDTLAGSTSSSFKPEARVAKVEVVIPGGSSIFQKLKKKRGLQ